MTRELEERLVVAEQQTQYLAGRPSAAGPSAAGDIVPDLNRLHASIRAVQGELDVLKTRVSFTENFATEMSAVFASMAPARLFECILESAMRHAGADSGAIGLSRGRKFGWIAVRGTEENLSGLPFRRLRARLTAAVREGPATCCLAGLEGGDSGLWLPLHVAGSRAVLLYLGRASQPFSQQELDSLPRTLGISFRVLEEAMNSINDAGVLDEEPAEPASRRFPQFVGTSPKLMAILDVVCRIAPTDVPLLIEGESGTGKEMIARAAFEAGSRRSKPFMAVNCGALPESLLDSELFGYEKGAFSGAAEARTGILEAASGGTIFLDEISEMSSALQVKLLRVLQSGEVRRIGSTITRRVDIRVIAATNQSLRDLVERGLFREDLYYRLNVVRVELPPLRERREDVPLLLQHFLDRHASEFGRPALHFSPAALGLLIEYDYPGNVRELANAVQRSALLCKTNTIGVNDLPEEIRAAVSRSEAPKTNVELKNAKARARRKISDQIEHLFLVQALKRTGGNVTKAARETSMNRSLFQQMVSKHRLDIRVFA